MSRARPVPPIKGGGHRPRALIADTEFRAATADRRNLLFEDCAEVLNAVHAVGLEGRATLGAVGFYRFKADG